MKDIKIFKTFTDNKEIAAVSKVLKNGWLTNGVLTKKFEKNLSKYLNSKNIVLTNSCTNGIFVVMKAIGLKRGDEIITSPFTFISTINSMHQLGLKIKFADINTDDYNIDLNSLKKKISKKTKCVLVTHYGGNPCNINKIQKICGNKIKLIEDAATALGSKVGRKKIGSFKNSIAIFSLYANKIITSGEGGIISLNNRKLSDKIRVMCSMGITKDPWRRSKNKLNYKFDLIEPGYKFNFTDIQASIGIQQLKKLDKIISYRRRLRKIYNNKLVKLVKKKYINIIKVQKNVKSAEYIYTILINEKFGKKCRDKLIVFLKNKGIQTSVHYTPANYLKYYKKKFKNQNITNSNKIFNNILSLPFHNRLRSIEIAYIAKEISNFFKNENKEK